MEHPRHVSRDPLKGVALADRQSRTGGAQKVRLPIGLLLTPLVAQTLLAGFP